MKYYSKIEYFFLRTIHVLAAAVVLLYWFAGLAVQCFEAWSAELFNVDECSRWMLEINIFVGLIPMLFVVLSGLVILLQQRGYKRVGYFMVPLAVIPLCYIGYSFLWPISYNVFFLVTGPILLAIALTPFYVLGKLIRHSGHR